MPSLGDQVREWHLGAQAVARGDWGCALRLFSGISEQPARICFNVGCVHLLAGDPEAALQVSAPGRVAETHPGGSMRGAKKTGLPTESPSSARTCSLHGHLGVPCLPP